MGRSIRKVTNEAQTSLDSLLHHGLGDEAAGVAAEIPDGGLPFRGDRGGQLLIQKPAKTITATSRVSRSVTRRPATNLLSMAMRLRVA